jgi:hypothetical protein
VLEGRLTEAVYREVEVEARVARKIGETVWGPGVITSAPIETIHKVTNTERTQRLVSLHLYSPPLSLDAMKVYADADSPEVEASIRLSAAGVL